MIWAVWVFGSPEPQAQDELLPSPNVRRPSCVVCRQQLLQTTSPLKLLGLVPRYLVSSISLCTITKFIQMMALGPKVALQWGGGVLDSKMKYT